MKIQFMGKFIFIFQEITSYVVKCFHCLYNKPHKLKCLSWWLTTLAHNNCQCSHAILLKLVVLTLPIVYELFFCSVEGSTRTGADEFKAEIRATATVVERLRDLETSFTDMLADLLDLLTECKCDLSKAQFYLNNLFKTEEFSQCSTFSLLLQQLHIRKGHIDTFNIYFLHKLVARFKKEELTKCIEKYEAKMKTFLEDTTVLNFQRAVVSRVEPVKPDQTIDITIRVSKTFAKDRTLKDMEELALNGFGENQRAFVRIHAKSGSVIILWFFPEALSGKLEHLAHENAAVFKDAEVEEVTVGGRVVFPCTLEEVRTSHGIDNLPNSVFYL